MNVRKPLYAVISSVLLVPLAAFAGPPAGDFDQTHGIKSSTVSVDQAASKSDRRENRNYVEVAVEELVGNAAKSREEVKRELAASPLPRVEA